MTSGIFILLAIRSKEKTLENEKKRKKELLIRNK